MIKIRPLRGFCSRFLYFFFEIVLVTHLMVQKSVHADPEKPRPSLSNLPVDLVLDQIYNLKPTPAIIPLKQALHALKDKKFELAKREAMRLQKSVLFSDYGFAIAGEVSQQEVELKIVNKKYLEALTLAKKSLNYFSKISLNSPYSPLNKTLPESIAKAELLIGKIYYLQKHWNESLTFFENAFERLVSSGISGSLAKIEPEYLAAYTEVCQNSRGLLCESWIRKLISFYPKQSNETKSIQNKIPTYFEVLKVPPPPKKQTQIYKALDLDVVAFDSARDLFWAGKIKAAIEAFQSFLDLYPRSSQRFRARFWLAQALKKEGELNRAQILLRNLVIDSPLTYFGLLSALETESNIEAAFHSFLPAVTTNDPYLNPSDMFRLKRAEQLIAGGLTEVAAQELRGIRLKDSFANSFLIYLAALNNEVRNYHESFVLISELIQRGEPAIASTFGLRLIFPLPNLDLIERILVESKNDLDPILALSLMKQESAFDSQAVSSSGASGLMQLMPATALEVDSTVRRFELSQASVNIALGTRYLKQMINKFQGNVVLALAAYNAGPNAVDRWIREGHAKRGMFGFIDSIPYKETREYVASILRNYYWYYQKIRGEKLQSFDSFWSMKE